MSEIRLKDNESLDNALKRFKRQCAKSGVMGELRKRYSAEEILGLLGYYAGIIPENRKATLQELLEKFSWEKVPRSNIIVNI